MGAEGPNVYIYKEVSGWTRENIEPCIRNLLLKYDEYFMENDEIKWSGSSGIGVVFNARGQNFDIELCIGSAGERFTDHYFCVSTPYYTFEEGLGGRKNLNVFLYILQDTLEFARPDYGFGINGELVEPLLGQVGIQELSHYLHPLNFFGWDETIR